MEKPISGWTLGEIAGIVGGQVEGAPETFIQRPVPAGDDDPAGITFAESEKYLNRIRGSSVGAVILDRAMPSIGKPTIRVDEPRSAFLRVLQMAYRAHSPPPGRHATAIVAATAQVHSTASIGPYCVVESGAVIGPETWLRAFVFVGEDVRIGSTCTLHPHVAVYERCMIGDRTVLHAGCTIGADGFGYVWAGEKQAKIPHVGSVIVGSDCELGANTCVDRATCGNTVIGDGTKLDNMVQIGHNTVVGKDTVIAAHSGFGGSTSVGNRVTVGGHVAVKDHVTIVDDVQLGGRSGVIDDILHSGAYLGLPAIEIRKALAQMALSKRLPELLDRIKKLEAEVASLRAQA